MSQWQDFNGLIRLVLSMVLLPVVGIIILIKSPAAIATAVHSAPPQTNNTNLDLYKVFTKGADILTPHRGSSKSEAVCEILLQQSNEAEESKTTKTRLVALIHPLLMSSNTHKPLEIMFLGDRQSLQSLQPLRSLQF